MLVNGCMYATEGGRRIMVKSGKSLPQHSSDSRRPDFAREDLKRCQGEHVKLREH